LPVLTVKYEPGKQGKNTDEKNIDAAVLYVAGNKGVIFFQID
jgi:hypothetical protein